jgi:DNA end-binding protein Ku
VLHFLPAEQLDPILLNRSYFVEPESAGSRAYVLLRDSLDRSGKVALAQVALRQRESLATLRTRDGLLVLETLLWPDEVRTPDFAFLDEDIEVRSQELKMAASLIESMTVDFDPDEYHDGYREALQELVNAKIEGRDVIQPEDEAGEAAEPTSLADALKASLAAAQEPRQAAGEVRAEAKSPRRAVGGGTRTRGTSGRTGAGRGSAAKESAAKDSAAKDGADKNGGTRASGTRASGTRAAGTRAAGTRASGTKDGGTKAGTSKPATSKGTRRRAS